MKQLSAFSHILISQGIGIKLNKVGAEDILVFVNLTLLVTYLLTYIGVKNVKLV